MSRQSTVLKPTQKPAVILVHGFRGSPLGLEAIAEKLRQAGFEVHIPAVPPFAGSPTLSQYKPREYADFLADYIRKHRLSRPILVGHSMGSVVVSATAKFHPELVHKKLILLSPISTKPARPFALISPLAAIVPRPVVDYLTTRFLFVPKDRELFKQTMEITHACSEDQPPTRSAIAAATRFSTDYCIYDFLPQQDTLIIAGAKDRLISQKPTRALAEKIQAQLQFIPNSGHLHNYERPHETAQLILDFIK